MFVNKRFIYLGCVYLKKKKKKKNSVIMRNLQHNIFM